MITISIPVLTLILVFVIAILVLTRFRAGVIGLLHGIWYGIEILAIGFWNIVTGAAPAVGATAATTVTLAGRLLQIVMILGLAYLIFLLVLVALASVGVITTGILTGQWLVTFLLLIALVGWGMLSLVPRLAIFRPLTFLRGWIVRPLVIVLTAYLAVGLVWSLIGQASPRLHRWTNNWLATIGISLDEGSSHSEPEQGSIRPVIEDTYAIPDTGEPPFFIRCGKSVKVTDWEGRKATETSEGLTKVMLKNKFEHYDGGPEGWVPTRVLGQKQITSSPGNPPDNYVALAEIPNSPTVTLSPGKYYAIPMEGVELTSGRWGPKSLNGLKYFEVIGYGQQLVTVITAPSSIVKFYKYDGV